MSLMVVGQDDKYKNGDVRFMHNTSGETTCDMYYDGKWFTGHAKCLPEDMDMWSERTGSTLAEIKANIKRLRYMRAQTRQEMKPLTLFESRLKCCKGYNHNSVEARRLRKEIWLYKNKIQEIQALLELAPNYEEKMQILRDYDIIDKKKNIVL